MKLCTLFPFLACLVVAGCQSGGRILVSKDASVIYQQGIPIQFSHKKCSIAVSPIRMRYSSQVSELPSFRISLLNYSGNAVDFSRENVKVFSGNRSIAILSRDVIEKRARNEARIAAIAVGIGAGIRSGAAAATPQTTTSYGTYSGVGPSGYSSGTFSSTSVTYNSAAQAITIAQIQSDMNRQLAEIASSRDKTIMEQGTILLRNTVRHGDFASGIVIIEAKTIQLQEPLKVIVSVAGESHEFLFSVSK